MKILSTSAQKSIYLLNQSSKELKCQKYSVQIVIPEDIFRLSIPVQKNKEKDVISASII